LRGFAEIAVLDPITGVGNVPFQYISNPRVPSEHFGALFELKVWDRPLLATEIKHFHDEHAPLIRASFVRLGGAETTSSPASSPIPPTTSPSIAQSGCPYCTTWNDYDAGHCKVCQAALSVVLKAQCSVSATPPVRMTLPDDHPAHALTRQRIHDRVQVSLLSFLPFPLPSFLPFLPFLISFRRSFKSSFLPRYPSLLDALPSLTSFLDILPSLDTLLSFLPFFSS
jgi:hypothetical protein